MLNSSAGTQADKIQIEFYRKLSGQERLKIASELTELSTKLINTGIRDQHPNWTEKQIHFAVIERILPKELFRKAYPAQH